MKKTRLPIEERPTIISTKKSRHRAMPSIDEDAEMKSFRRKWAIINMIRDAKNGYTIEELAEHFKVSPRTIRRDIGIFDEIFGGFDAENEKWGKKRFSLERIPFDGKNSGLNREELVAFCVAQRLMEPLKGTAFGDSMKSGCEKIRRCLKESTVERADKVASFFYRSEYRRPHNRRTGHVIGEILKAMLSSCGLRIRYFSVQEGKDETCSVLPYTFLYNEGIFYLVGYSSKTSSVDFWKMNRIRAVRITDTRFVPPEKFDVHKYVNGGLFPSVGSEPTTRVKIRFAPSVVRYIREQNLSSIKKQTDRHDGSLDIEMKVVPGEEFIHWIMGFGTTAEVLEPANVRNAVFNEIKSVKESYASEM